MPHLRDDGGDVVALVRAASREQLVAAWPGGGRSPPGASRQLLELAAAWSIQAKRHGGLKRSAATGLKRQTGGGGRQIAKPRRKIQPGVRLVREWNGRTHIVDATPDGFVYAGQAFRSLSAIAREITGARWSGPRFFGLDQRMTADR